MLKINFTIFTTSLACVPPPPGQEGGKTPVNTIGEAALSTTVFAADWVVQEGQGATASTTTIPYEGRRATVSILAPHMTYA